MMEIVHRKSSNFPRYDPEIGAFRVRCTSLSFRKTVSHVRYELVQRLLSAFDRVHLLVEFFDHGLGGEPERMVSQVPPSRSSRVTCTSKP